MPKSSIGWLGHGAAVAQIPKKPGSRIFVACRPLLALFACLGLILLPASQGWADGAEQSPSLTVERIDARIKQLNETKDLDEQVKQKALSLYDDAKEELGSAERWNAKKQAFDMTVKSSNKTIAETKHQIELLAVPEEVVVPPGATLDGLNEMLDEAEGKVKQLERELIKAKNELRDRKLRRAEIPKFLRSAKQRLAEVEFQLESKTPTKESEIVQEARDVLLRASVSALEWKTAAYEAETAAYEATTALVPLQRDLAAARLRSAETKVDMLRKAVRQRRKEEILGQAKQAQRDLPKESSRAIYDLAKRSAELLAYRQSLNEQMEKAVDRRIALDKKLAALTRQYAWIEQQIEVVGPNDARDMLRRRVKLPDAGEKQRNIQEVARRESEIARVRYQILDLEEEQEKLGDMDQVVQDILQNINIEDEEQAKQYDLLIRYLGGMKKRYLDQLIEEYNGYYVELIELQMNERQLMAQNEEFERLIGLIDQRALWIRTSPTANFKEIADSARKALMWLGRPRTWSQVVDSLNQSRQNPLVWLLALFVFLPLVYFRGRMRRAVESIGGYAAKGGAQRFLPTAEVLVLTVLLAVLWPGLLWLLSFCIATSKQTTLGVEAIAQGLTVVVLVVFPLEFLRQVCRRHGLAEVHFGWPANSVTQLRRRLGCFIWVGCPWLFVAATFRALGNEIWNGSLGRLAFVVFLMVLIVFAHRVLRPAGPVMREFLTERPGGWLMKTKLFWYAVGVIAPMLLIVLTLFGYYHAAWHFASRLMVTAWLLVGLLLLGAVLLRWVLMIRRKLAIAHATARRELAQMTSEHPAAEGEETPIEASTPEPEVDLAKLNAQTRRMVYGSLAAACVLGVCLIWADVLPAFNVLHRVSIGSTITTVAVPDSEGVVRPVEQVENITLANLALAIVGIIVTWVLTRNFPGLLEFLVLQHLNMDSGLRHAITSVSRYIIVLVGVFFCFSTLGISWSKVQWLVAGVSVGLGFGLQEIFANFVSGLVILFERPMRPGDIITIGDATGKVSRIQIRATTITDWDRKELVVPNKEFITGRLLNWTLTDKTNRVTINVGVAYGSDPDRVREILLEIAKLHPKVLDSPSPIAICNEFGASALNFSLRIYLESMVGRLMVIHELHAAIHNRLQREGITIAFPQLDLHVRSFGTSSAASMPPDTEETAGTTSNGETTPPSSTKPSTATDENPDTAEER